MEVQSTQDLMVRDIKEMIQSCTRILSHMESDVSVTREHRLQIQPVQQVQSRIRLDAGVEEVGNRGAMYDGLSARLQHDTEEREEDLGPNQGPMQEVANQGQLSLDQPQPLLLEEAQQPPAEQERRPPHDASEEPLGDDLEKLRLAALELKIADMYTQLSIDEVKAAASTFSLMPRNISYNNLWKEWFSSEGFKPSIYSLERYYPKWRARKGDKLRQDMTFKKRIVTATLREISKADGPFSAKVNLGMAKVKAAIEEAGSLNLYYKTTQKKKQ